MTNKELHRQIKAALDDTGTALVLAKEGSAYGRARIFKLRRHTRYFLFEKPTAEMLYWASQDWQHNPWVNECCWEDIRSSLHKRVDNMVNYQNHNVDTAPKWEVYGIDKDGEAWIYE